jgi:EpsI family protein
MELFKKRCRIVVLLLAAAAALTTILTMTEATATAPADLERLPLEIGDFVGADIPVEQEVKDILETPNVLMRDYVSRDGVRVALAIVYYEQYRVYFHMPEGCMVGRGSLIVANEKENIHAGTNAPPLEANKLVLKKHDGSEYVYYFFVSGDLVTPSYPLMRLHLMMEHLRRRRTGTAMVRFSTRTTEQDARKQLARLKEFISQFSPLLPEYF